MTTPPGSVQSAVALEDEKNVGPRSQEVFDRERHIGSPAGQADVLVVRGGEAAEDLGDLGIYSGQVWRHSVVVEFRGRRDFEQVAQVGGRWVRASEERRVGGHSGLGQASVGGPAGHPDHRVGPHVVDLAGIQSGSDEGVKH